MVAYDDYRNVLAGRIVWVLRSYGHRAAFVLDGGLGAWRAAGLPLEPGEVEPRAGRRRRTRCRDRLEGLIDLDGVRRAIELRRAAGRRPQARRVRRRRDARSPRRPHPRRAATSTTARCWPTDGTLPASPTSCARGCAEAGVDLDRPHRRLLQRRRVGDGGRPRRRAGRRAPPGGLRRLVERVGEPRRHPGRDGMIGMSADMRGTGRRICGIPPLPVPVFRRSLCYAGRNVSVSPPRRRGRPRRSSWRPTSSGSLRPTAGRT